MAQGLSAMDAAAAGACLHSFAADRVAECHGRIGLLATDLMSELRAILNETAQ
jgi:NAD(P)H-hydrate epimerase